MCAQNEFDGTAPLTTVLFISPLCFKTDYLLLVNAFFAAGSAIYYKNTYYVYLERFRYAYSIEKTQTKHKRILKINRFEILDTVEDCIILIQIWQTTVTRMLEQL